MLDAPRATTIIVALISLSISSVAFGQVARSEVESTIAKLTPGARPLADSEIGPECGPERHAAITGDFDGDGRGDHAVLVVLHTGETTRFNGRTFTSAQMRVVALLRRDAGFEIVTLDEFPVDLPAGVTLDVDDEHRGKAREASADESAGPSGISLGFCEKSSGTYVWNGSGFTTIDVSD